MPVEIVWRPEIGKKVENFFNNSGYKEYLENAVAFNRKLNEERKMRIPYIDGQGPIYKTLFYLTLKKPKIFLTGVAQRHYNSQRLKRERMPGTRPGQVYSYPQKHWKKKRYQYLRYFMQPKKLERDVTDIIQSSQDNSNSGVGVVSGSTAAIGINEDSNASGGTKDDLTKASDWSYYDDIFHEGDEDMINSDSDFEYDETYARKKSKAGKKPPKQKSSSKSNTGSGGGLGSGGTGSGGTKRRTHADQIPDSEKPFSCEYCGVKYKTRPGLTYHVKNTHKDKEGNLINPAPTVAPISAATAALVGEESYLDDGPGPYGSVPAMGMNHGPNFTEMSNMRYHDSGSNSMHGPGPTHGRPAAARPIDYREDSNSSSYSSNEASNNKSGKASSSSTPTPTTATPPKKAEVKEVVPPLGYCDFCLGDANENKKTNEPEELVSCSECGRSGHPTCLQFTENMLVSVRKYAWQCIECKCCTICGTAENDDQLLFCDDCDRGYHMYCIVPKIKEPPEGSWSCKPCIETFHG